MILAIEEKTLLDHCPLNIEGKQLSFLNNYNVMDATINGIIELFILETKAGDRNGLAYIKNLTQLLANHYIQNYSNFLDLQNKQLSSSKFAQSQVDKVDSYIHDNIGSNLSVESFADLLGCSKFYFLREFKKFTGVTPYQYLMTKRLERAKTLLDSENANIAAIAHQLSFNDQSHFTRTFKNQFGLTPGQYLKQ